MKVTAGEGDGEVLTYGRRRRRRRRRRGAERGGDGVEAARAGAAMSIGARGRRRRGAGRRRRGGGRETRGDGSGAGEIEVALSVVYIAKASVPVCGTNRD